MRAAVELGRLAANGLLSPAECGAPLIAAGIAAGPGRDPAGLRMRLAHAFADAMAAEERALVLAGMRVRAALRPALLAGAARTALLQRAEQANRGVFSPGELLVLTEREVSRALHRDTVG